MAQGRLDPSFFTFAIGGPATFVSPTRREPVEKRPFLDGSDIFLDQIVIPKHTAVVFYRWPQTGREKVLEDVGNTEDVLEHMLS